MTGTRENSGRHAGKRAGDGRQTWNDTCATKKDTSRGSVRPTPPKDARETGSRPRHNRRRRRSWWGTDYISQGRSIEGNGVSFLVDTGSGVSILAARTWRKWGRAEDELTRYWGRLCSVEGQALECLSSTRLAVTLGTRAIKWNFIVAEIRDDEEYWGTIWRWHTSSRCGRARVPYIS